MRYDRLSRSRFRIGEYVGYADGVWIVQRSASAFGRWEAHHRDKPSEAAIYSASLREMDGKLEEYAAEVEGYDEQRQRGARV